MKIRVCKHCSSNFSSKLKGKRYCSKECQRISSKNKEWLKTKVEHRARLKQILAGAKNRAKLKQLPFDLDHSYLMSLWNEQSGLCAIVNRPFDLTMPQDKGIARYNAPSLDRIVPSLGYVKGNVRLVWYQINMAIGHYGMDSLFKLAELIQENRGGLG